MGLLASSQIPAGRTVFYGIIADGIHTHPAALRIAHRTHPRGKCELRDVSRTRALLRNAHETDFAAGTRKIAKILENKTEFPSFSGLVLVTDAVPAMGLPMGTHHMGSQTVEVREMGAFIAGTNTLCGRYTHCLCSDAVSHCMREQARGSLRISEVQNDETYNTRSVKFSMLNLAFLARSLGFRHVGPLSSGRV